MFYRYFIAHFFKRVRKPDFYGVHENLIWEKESYKKFMNQGISSSQVVTRLHFHYKIKESTKIIFCRPCCGLH